MKMDNLEVMNPLLSEDTMLELARSGRASAMHARLEGLAATVFDLVDAERLVIERNGQRNIGIVALTQIAEAIIDTKIDLERAIETVVLERARERSQEVA